MHRLSLLFGGDRGAYDHVGTICGDVDVPCLAERSDQIGQLYLRRERMEVTQPLRTCAAAAPLVRREIINDDRLIGT